MATQLQRLVSSQRITDRTLANAVRLTVNNEISDDDFIYFTHLLQASNSATRSRYRRQIESKEMIRLIPKSHDLPHRPRGTRNASPSPRLTFIDLFAGAGGMRLGMQAAGGKCLFSSEIDNFARATYFRNFGEFTFGDIQLIDREDIPTHDVLVGGFPCQPFSIAGLQRGFEDKRGGLFFEIDSILKTHEPKALLLENVGGLNSRRSSDALGEMLSRLKKRGYHCPTPKVLNARHFGVPQNRARIFIVGFRSEAAMRRFEYPEANREEVKVGEILSRTPVDPRYYLSAQLLSTLKVHRSRHRKRGNGFGFQVLGSDSVANAIVVGGMGHERNLIRDPLPISVLRKLDRPDEVNSEGIRRMTPDEWSQLQGYPRGFKFPVSDTQAYKQLGNSVAVPLISRLGQQIALALRR